MDEDQEFETDQQPQNKQPKITPLLPYMWKKGQSGNPAGRPKGKTMKDYAREMLECMTNEERQEFMHGLPKEIIWKMAEGNPSNNTDLTTGGQPIEAIIGMRVIKDNGTGVQDQKPKAA